MNRKPLFYELPSYFYMSHSLPERFKARYSQLVDDPDAFFTCLRSMPPKSFRVNTLKTSVDLVKARFEGYGIPIKPMPWYEHAFTSEHLDIGSSLEHFMGHIYFQELGSMLPPLLVRPELEYANRVLDTCAAPGSKTTQLAALMENHGVIVANDVDYSRIRALKFNLEKTGTLNTVVTNQNLMHFPKLEFDVILVDVPCSAEGTIRKSDSVLSIWSEKIIKHHARLQKQLLLKAFDLLSPDGILIYSTCTFAPEENEEVISTLIDQREAILEDIQIPNMKITNGIEEWDGVQFPSELKKTVRIWPHHNNSDGFFLARVRK